MLVGWNADTHNGMLRRCHAAHRENLELRPLAGKVGVRLVPTDLCFHAPFVGLRDERLMRDQPECDLSALNILPNRTLADLAVRHLGANAFPNTECRMPLLPRSLPIVLQDAVDERRYRAGDLPSLPFGPLIRGLGNALPIASRTIRRCTFSLLATQ